MESKKLYEDLNTNILPIIEPLTEKYFGKKFIRKNLKDYEIIDDRVLSGRIELKKGEEKFKIILGVKKNYPYIPERGIITILHELSHLYIFTQWPIKEKKFDKFLKEAYCDLSAYEISEILINSNEPRSEEIRDRLEGNRHVSEEYHKALLNNEYDIKYEHYLGGGLKYSHLNLEWCLAYQYLNSEKDLEKRKLMLQDNKNYKIKLIKKNKK